MLMGGDERRPGSGKRRDRASQAVENVSFEEAPSVRLQVCRASSIGEMGDALDGGARFSRRDLGHGKRGLSQ